MKTRIIVKNNCFNPVNYNSYPLNLHLNTYFSENIFNIIFKGIRIQHLDKIYKDADNKKQFMLSCSIRNEHYFIAEKYLTCERKISQKTCNLYIH